MSWLLEGRASVGDRPLFAPLRLELPRGSWTCLLGASGMGKSTLLRLIAGLPTGVRFDGSIRGHEPVALMAQDPGLCPWLDVTGNVLLGARLRGEPPERARAARLVERTGLRDQAAQRPAALSGGQRQRVALARALMEDRPTVLLDEPFSALDAGTRAGMQDLAAELLRGRTVLMVTHDPAEAARLADRILLLTPEGLEEHPVPSAPTPRAPHEPETVACQAALLQRMMAA